MTQRQPRKLDPSLTFIKAYEKWEAENKAAEKSAAIPEEIPVVEPVVKKNPPTKKKVKDA